MMARAKAGARNQHLELLDPVLDRAKQLENSESCLEINQKSRAIAKKNLNKQ
jgi:hypothetical protein